MDTPAKGDRMWLFVPVKSQIATLASFEDKCFYEKAECKNIEGSKKGKPHIKNLTLLCSLN